jgi:hypothetical protein
VISSTFTYPTLRPYGSHPATDHLFGSGDLRVRHYGVHASRTEKIRAISSWEPCFDSLMLISIRKPRRA